MRIEADAVIPFERELVFRTYRDEMPRFVEYFPNVRSIVVREREDTDGVIRLLNEWSGGGEIPDAVRSFVPDDLLTWDDHATWDPEAWECRWQIETHAFREAVSCSGRSRFIELDGGRTRMEMIGEIGIDLKRVKHVPDLIAGSVGRKVEQFLVRGITTNLTAVSDALTRYLQDQQRAGQP